MKNFFKWLAIIALVATIGFGFTACDDGSTGGGNGGNGGGGDADLTGLWSSADGDGFDIKRGDSFTLSQYSDEYARGTYTVSGNRITLALNEFKGEFLNDNGFDELEGMIASSQWYNKQQMRTTFINYLVNLGLTQAQAEALYIDRSDGPSMADTVDDLYSLTFTGNYNSSTVVIVIDGTTFTKGSVSTLPAPSGTKAEALSSSEMKVSWNAVSGAKSYKVYNSYSSNGAFGWLITETTTSITNFNLPEDTTIYYKVSSVDVNGREGPQSAVFSATTLPTVNLSLDGLWNDWEWNYMISDSTAKITQICPSTLPVWTSAYNKGYVKLGDTYMRNINNTGTYTWSCQLMTVTWNNSNPSVATGTGWMSATITMDADGQSFICNDVTYTRGAAPAPTNYSLDGTWNMGGHTVTVSGATGEYVGIDGTLMSLRWQDAIRKGYVKVGDVAWRNITPAGDLKWNLQDIGVRGYTSNPDVAIGMAYTNSNIVMNVNGQTFDIYRNGVLASTWTRQ